MSHKPQVCLFGADSAFQPLLTLELNLGDIPSNPLNHGFWYHPDCTLPIHGEEPRQRKRISTLSSRLPAHFTQAHQHDAP